MDEDLWYFAYGSNLLVDQKEARTGSIRKALPCRLKEFRLAFNKRCSNGNVAANLVAEPTEVVWGVAYLCHSHALREMDGWEGGYNRAIVTVETTGGEALEAITYLANADHVCDESAPKDDYLNRILDGARHHRLPLDYICSIEMRAGRHQCDDHERQWRSYFVDKNLDSAWLASLNDLAAFNLISICESHPSETRTRFRCNPHINLRLATELAKPLAKKWEQASPSIQTLLENEFSPADTTVTAELRRKIHKGQRARTADELVVRITGQLTADAESRNRVVRGWFERCVASVSNLDRFFLRILESF